MVNDFVMGSIVNAVQMLGVRLVMVLGHTKCGMVARAVHHWAKHEARKRNDSTADSDAQARCLIPYAYCWDRHPMLLMFVWVSCCLVSIGPPVLLVFYTEWVSVVLQAVQITFLMLLLFARMTLLA